MVTESNTKLMTEYVLETSHVESEKWMSSTKALAPLFPLIEQEQANIPIYMYRKNSSTWLSTNFMIRKTVRS